jgi:hypothetical protein
VFWCCWRRFCRVRAAAQEASPFVVRILQLSMSRYTCTALTADRQLEQLTMVTNQGSPARSELRRGPATDEDVHRVDELLFQPQFHSRGF